MTSLCPNHSGVIMSVCSNQNSDAKVLVIFTGGTIGMTYGTQDSGELDRTSGDEGNSGELDGTNGDKGNLGGLGRTSGDERERKGAENSGGSAMSRITTHPLAEKDLRQGEEEVIKIPEANGITTHPLAKNDLRQQEEEVIEIPEANDLRKGEKKVTEIPEAEVLYPVKNALVKTLRKLPFLHDEQYAQQTGLYKQKNTLVVPLSKENRRIVYTVIEYSPLLDSCNMTADDWATIGKDIEEYYDQYNGFVILHGTDTMAYTASALSFMCENLGKPVILTGSQVPIFQPRSDGRDNLLGALLIAGQFDIPEVCLYFHNKLYRGNCVTKVNAESFNAFFSPNLPPLANAEVNIKVNWNTVWKANTTAKFAFNTQMNHNVGVLRLFPGITADTVRAFLQPPMEGIVLETYGSGNAPDNRDDLLNEIRNATERGLIIINCTRCLRGTVTTSYATGQALSKAGVVPGFDMTSEAAFSKLSYVLAKQDLSIEEKKKMLSCNLRGEMVADSGGAEHSLSDSSLIQGIAWSIGSFRFLNISCKEELEDALKPSLACAAARIGDIDALEALRELGADLSNADYDGRTPLHIATCEGHLNVVEYLLGKGATVHAKDRFGDSPLHNAVRLRHTDVVQLLRENRAHFSQDEIKDAGTELCRLAASGDLDGLKIWKSAGVDLTMTRYDGKTPIKVAKDAKNKGVVTFLKQATESQTQIESTEQTRLHDSKCCIVT